jgi:hypothetical protein
VEENSEEKGYEQGIPKMRFLEERETTGNTERELRDLNGQTLLSVQ